MIAYLDNLLFSLPLAASFAICAVAMVAMAFAAYATRHLNLSGCVCAALLGLVLMMSLHFEGFFLMLFFYVSCNLVGKLSLLVRQRRGEVGQIEKKGSRRDAMQVIANGLMALGASILFMKTGKPLALMLYGTAVAEAEADTFAGEIGRLSSKAPVSIWTGKPVAPGLSGGVTLLGFLAGLASSVVTALCWLVLFDGVTLAMAAVVSLCGFAGCVFDSLLGATCQAVYVDKDGKLTERDEQDGQKLERVRGISFVDNDMVNLMSNVFSCVVCLACQFAFLSLS